MDIGNPYDLVEIPLIQLIRKLGLGHDYGRHLGRGGAKINAIDRGHLPIFDHFSAAYSGHDSYHLRDPVLPSSLTGSGGSTIHRSLSHAD